MPNDLCLFVELLAYFCCFSAGRRHQLDASWHFRVSGGCQSVGRESLHFGGWWYLSLLPVAAAFLWLPVVASTVTGATVMTAAADCRPPVCWASLCMACVTKGASFMVVCGGVGVQRRMFVVVVVGGRREGKSAALAVVCAFTVSCCEESAMRQSYSPT